MTTSEIQISSETALAVRPPVEIIEKLVACNDLKALSPAQRLSYYNWRCHSIGIDPAAQPFEYLELDGKLVLYPKAQLADQLRSVHKLSVRLGESAIEHGIYTRVAVASAPDGRVAENIGAVSVREPDRIKVWENRQSQWVDNPKAGQQITGIALANAIKKAATQAQRRATFSLMGLGGQDVDDVEGVQRLDVAAVHDPKGLLPTDNNPEPTPEPAAPPPEGPIDWRDPDQWPAGDILQVDAKITGVEVRSSTKARWVTVQADDGSGEVEFSTFHLSAEPVLRAAVSRVLLVTYAKTAKANRLLAAKEEQQ